MVPYDPLGALSLPQLPRAILRQLARPLLDLPPAQAVVVWHQLKLSPRSMLGVLEELLTLERER